MSVKQMALVWEHDFDHAEQSIMLALADHAHDDGTEIRPSVARIAWKTGYEQRQVHRILKRLRDEKKVLVLVREGGGRGNPNVYRFDWTKADKKSPFKSKRVTSESIKGDIAMSEEPSSMEPSLNDTSNDVSANGEVEPSPMPIGQFGIKELADRVRGAGNRGAQLHSPTDRERRDFGAQFRQADKDGHGLGTMLLALDYMVAKAAGEIDGEPKAWCGFRTALDRVLEGWRPDQSSARMADPDKPRSPVWYASLYEVEFATVERWIKEGIGHREIERRLESGEVA